jgi:hypothetical protein
LSLRDGSLSRFLFVKRKRGKEKHTHAQRRACGHPRRMPTFGRRCRLEAIRGGRMWKAPACLVTVKTKPEPLKSVKAEGLTSRA